MERKRVGIVLVEDVEVLDFCGPFEVFSVTRLNDEKRREEPSPFEVLLVAESPGAVTTTGGMKVLPHYTFANCPHVDIVVVLRHSPSIATLQRYAQALGYRLEVRLVKERRLTNKVSS